MSRDIRRRASAWLVETEAVLPEGGGGKHPEGARDLRHLIGENISEHIFCQDHIEAARLPHKKHRGGIHEGMAQLHLRISLPFLLHDPSPKPRAVQNIRLVHGAKPPSPPSGDRKGLPRDPPDLGFPVAKLVPRDELSPLPHCAPFAEIEPSGELPHHHKVKAVPDDGLPKRAGIPKLRVELRRPEIAKEPEPLPKLQKTGLRSFFRREKIPGRDADLSSDRSHQHRVRSSAFLEGLLRQRLSEAIDRRAAHEKLPELKMMTVERGDPEKYLPCLPDDFRTDPVSLYHSNPVFHFPS